MVVLLIEPEVAVTVVLPVPTLDASPPVLMVATPVVEDPHVAELLRFCVLPSVNVPVAVNCWVVPRAIAGLAGVMAMETRAAAVTVSVVEPAIEPEVAVMVVDPGATLVARPWLPEALLIVAIPAVAELHCTVCVMFWVLPSVNVPVAVNCWVVPKGRVGMAGVTAIETTAAGLTVNNVVPETTPELAVMVVVPVAALIASP